MDSYWKHIVFSVVSEKPSFNLVSALRIPKDVDERKLKFAIIDSQGVRFPLRRDLRCLIKKVCT